MCNNGDVICTWAKNSNTFFRLDVIMDMLGNQKMRQLITDYYQSTDEPRLVSRAVLKARTKERLLSIDMMDGSEAILPSMWDKLKYVSCCCCCLLLLVLFVVVVVCCCWWCYFIVCFCLYLLREVKWGKR